ncbi:MAG: hypothetical protein K9J13_01715 [Saprospiraceae bacterium]|nr:hypothetical protein [Saprospiraceae bacterium]
MKNKIILIAILLLGCKSNSEIIQEISDKFENKEFYGKVIKKEYLDWNHASHHLIIQDTSGQEVILELSEDRNVSSRTGRSVTWENLNVNYIVAKDSGSFEIRYTSKYHNGWKSTTVKY